MVASFAVQCSSSARCMARSNGSTRSARQQQQQQQCRAFSPAAAAAAPVCRRVPASAARSRQLVAQVAAQAAGKPPKQQMLVYVPPHPLVKHWLAVARNVSTPTPIFRSAIAELGRILIYEAVREFLPTVDGMVETPMGPADVTCVDPMRPIKVVPILRAGLVLLEQTATLLPASETYHLGYVRDDETLQARSYLNKLPAKFAEDDLILITDPMLATGGTMMQALQEIVSRGADPANIRVVAVVAAPPALKLMADTYPGLKVYTAIIDAEVNEKGYIIPGLGDAGDRAFGTA